MICSKCKEFVPIENKDTQTCATCNKEDRDMSDLYAEIRLLFLQIMQANDEVCPIYGTPITIYDDIHHKMGRVGYASEEKRQQSISLLIDVDFFLAVSRPGHMWIEANREKAIARGFTIPRSATHNG